ncbi:chemotaxis response regulator protein-glutamate methylesterase [Nitrospirota bacterium]
MSDKIRAMVVDDSAYNRQTIKAILQEDPNIEVVGIASDGVDAMSKVMRLDPDIITLDYEMPEMDGFSFLRWLMKEKPTPVIMVTSVTDKKVAFKALELGAMDFVLKPTKRASAELNNIKKDLLTKVHAVKSINMNVLKRNIKTIEEKKNKHSKSSDKMFVAPYEVIAIGSSTGGPSALQMILTELPSDLPCAVVISQHMPRGFTKPLAERLDKLCNLRIMEGRDGDILKKGAIYICPGGYHMSFDKRSDNINIILNESKSEDKYVPSVDKMMTSISTFMKARVMGIVLTGMGNDGAEGMVKIRRAGGYTIAESEESSVVFGMPQEVIKAKAAETVLPVDLIASEIRRIAIGERRA